MEDKIDLTIKVVEKMMADTTKMRDDAFNLRKWYRVAELESYRDGLLQALIVFQQALDKGENNG